MGYSGMLLLPSIMLFPFIAVAAGALYWLAKWKGVTPHGVPGMVSFALIGCALYAALFFYATAELMILTPARLQKEYLGTAVGTPISLRDFRHWGFQDPASEWRYALSGEEAALLSKKCVATVPAQDPGRCLLFHGMDERWFAEVSLEGSTLYMIDGLH